MQRVIFVACIGSMMLLFGNMPVYGQVAIPIYGNWCGPNHGFKKPPIDPVDQVCEFHDRCAVQKRYGDPLEKIQHCDCDQNVLRNMPAAIAKTKSQKGKNMGRVIMAYFQNAVCYCKQKVCISVPSCKNVNKCVLKPGKPVCTVVPSCKKVKKCKKVLGKEQCVWVPQCEKKKVCTTPQVKVCVPTPHCTTVQKCDLVNVYGTGGRCLGRKKP